MQLRKTLQLLTLLSLLAVLAPITGDNSWLTFLSFLAFGAFSKVTRDERMKQNSDKAARNGFVAAMIGNVLLIFYIIQKPSTEQLILAIQGITWLMSLTVGISYTIYDRKGS
jgi:ABC-type iron transport system FetAB permease component